MRVNADHQRMDQQRDGARRPATQTLTATPRASGEAPQDRPQKEAPIKFAEGGRGQSGRMVLLGSHDTLMPIVFGSHLAMIPTQSRFWIIPRIDRAPGRTVAIRRPQELERQAPPRESGGTQ